MELFEIHVGAPPAEQSRRGQTVKGFPGHWKQHDVLEVLSRFQNVGVDQVIMHMQMGGVPHDDIMRSLAVLGTDVLPKLR